MKTREELSDLFERYLKGSCTAIEKQELLLLLADPANDALFNEVRDQYTDWPETIVPLDGSTSEEVWRAIQTGTLTATPVPKRKYYPLYRAAAAACIVLVTLVAWFWLGRSPQHSPVSQTTAPVVSPGAYGALLTLENGSTVQLDSMQTGKVNTPSGEQVEVQKGLLSYDKTFKKADADSALPGAVAPINYHKIVTPRGNHFQLVLSDGTKVWLNAASSIRYPAFFTGADRSVEITGEAYFEVAHNAQKPFRVTIPNKAQIEVLGTHFNVNAYADEPVTKTTLLEGKVKITTDPTTNKGAVILKPAEECMLQNGQLQVQPANVEMAIAWTRDQFYFNSADLATVMRSISRWYDVDIKLDAGINARFSGSMYRKKDINEILTIISFVSNVQCRLNNKTVIVSSK